MARKKVTFETQNATDKALGNALYGETLLLTLEEFAFIIDRPLYTVLDWLKRDKEFRSNLVKVGRLFFMPTDKICLYQ